MYICSNKFSKHNRLKNRNIGYNTELFNILISFVSGALGASGRFGSLPKLACE